ncbi:hypothetical protein AB0E59_36010 [Lentzea sp. NPDC034063]|uniref:hypothetical protein n=1 Tax=unclassified Lentzea TaxID=2643253 RepID=UPI0034076B76
MLIVTRSVEVAAPFARTVRQWSEHERTSRSLSGSLASFQRVTDETTRVILAKDLHVVTAADVVKLMLDNDLRRFKRAVESRRSFLPGVVDWIRTHLS